MAKNIEPQSLYLKRLEIDAGTDVILYLHERCAICQQKGFDAKSRIYVTGGHTRGIIATVNTVKSNILKMNEASLSEYAWQLLKVKEGDAIHLAYPKPLESLSFIRGKIYGEPFKKEAIYKIVKDIVQGRLSNVHLSAFLTASAGGRLTTKEIIYFTKAMVDIGNRLIWPDKLIVDKHCIGGLPGNRTTLIIVPIVAAFGLMIPKTSSRAITSSAGTADTMEMLAPVELEYEQLKKVVKKERGCIAWGGASSLSPADDVLIRIERELDLDSQGQLVASILSKKIAAGSTHLVVDVPVGPTAKMRDKKSAKSLEKVLQRIGKKLGIAIKVLLTDGSQPVGHGIGPALEARDVLAVLQNKPGAPQDLLERSLELAGVVLEFSPKVKKGKGRKIAEEILYSGEAWQKFRSICEAQGGLRIVPKAAYTQTHFADKKGRVVEIDNRRIARLAKLAGAPQEPTAGVDLHVKIGSIVQTGQSILTVHAEREGELEYALDYLQAERDMIQLKG